MGLRCKGICHTIPGSGPRVYKPYHRGFRYCGTCELFIPIQSILCPCCKTLLRYRPRSSAEAVIKAREYRLKVNEQVKDNLLAINELRGY